MAASQDRVTKQHDAAVNTEKPHIARTTNDSKSFVLCPYNAQVDRAASLPSSDSASSKRPRLNGCSANSGSHWRLAAAKPTKRT